MIRKELSPGDIVDSRCTRCRSLMNHTIIAMVEDRVVRVQCNTCGGIHNYHPEKPVKTATPRTAKTGAPAAPRQNKKDPAAAERREWEALQLVDRSPAALPYAMTGKYRLNEVVRHPLFGLGLVTRLPGPGKVEILFESGRKLLRCQ